MSRPADTVTSPPAIAATPCWKRVKSMDHSADARRSWLRTFQPLMSCVGSYGGDVAAGGERDVSAIANPVAFVHDSRPPMPGCGRAAHAGRVDERAATGQGQIGIRRQADGAGAGADDMVVGKRDAAAGAAVDQPAGRRPRQGAVRRRAARRAGSSSSVRRSGSASAQRTVPPRMKPSVRSALSVSWPGVRSVR